MADWKDSLNLPRTDFPMKANLQTAEPQALARWEEMGLYDRIRDRAGGPSEVRPARRAAVRQRPDSPRDGPQQDPQGLRRQVADDGGVRFAVRAGLRLPRTADRAEGGPRARVEEARDEPGRLPPRLPRLRRAVHRRDDRGVQAARRLRRLGASVPDDGVQVPGGHRAGARQVRGDRAWSTRARSPCTGASTAARRWPRPKSNTRITPRPRSTSSSRSRPTARASWAAASRSSRAATSRC